MLDPLAKSTSDPVIPSAHFLISETSHQRPYKERRESLGSLGRSLSTSHLRVPSHSPFCCISRAPLKDNLSDRLLIFGRKFYLICLATLGTTFRIMPRAVCSCPSLMAMNTGLEKTFSLSFRILSTTRSTFSFVETAGLSSGITAISAFPTLLLLITSSMLRNMVAASATVSRSRWP